MRSVRVTVQPDGSIEYLQHECTEQLVPGRATRRRASHIVPRRALQRVAFWACRLGGDASRLAAWTRAWRCDWLVDLGPSGGPVLGPFEDREQAIEAEELWLWENAS